MNVYTPTEYASLRHDLEYVLRQLGELYDVNITPAGMTCTSLMRHPVGAHWSSSTSQDHFNALIPRIKMLHMAMYAILEAVARKELQKGTVSAAFELMDPLFTPFRHLNNQFKHFDKRGVDIELIHLAYIQGKSTTSMEPMFRVDGRNLPYGRFVVMFLTLLEKAGAITFAR